MSEKIKEIETQISKLTEDYEEALKLSHQWSSKTDLINSERRKLEREKVKLLAEESKSKIASKFLSNNPNFKYVKRSNHTCRKCHQFLEMFETNTGIGSVDVGVCPKCECEIDFSDHGSW